MVSQWEKNKFTITGLSHWSAVQFLIVGYVCWRGVVFVLLAVLVVLPVCEAGSFEGRMCANGVRAHARINASGGG